MEASEVDRIMSDVMTEARRLLDKAISGANVWIPTDAVSLARTAVLTVVARGYVNSLESTVRFAKYSGDCPCGISARECGYHKDM